MMRGFLTAMIAVVIAYGAAFALWVFLLPQTPAVQPKADGIVALTGGGERLDKAAMLLENGAGKRLLISGVDLATSRHTLKAVVHGGAHFDCCVDIDYAAEDTYGNAVQTARWARAHRFDSLVIVTARYHMPRAMHEFRSVMPDITLLAYPVAQDNVRLSGWWRHPATIEFLNREFVKYLTSLVMASRAGGQ
jgi:uncharacterized SAM-binding protein YcdF (DUF218 family)